MSRQRALVSLASRLSRASVHGVISPSALYLQAVRPTAVAGLLFSGRNHIATARGFTASSLRSDVSEKELASVVTSECESEKASYEIPEVRKVRQYDQLPGAG
jgi:hypothetical protein